MIQLYSLMWILAAFFAILGFMRGWNREVVTLAGIALGMFILFQFDFIIRGLVLLPFPRAQAFFLQAAIFLTVVFFAYQDRTIGRNPGQRRRGDDNLQSGILGSLVGALNGYLIGGALWYFMDINEYPMTPYIMAPPPNSPSANFLDSMPLVLLSGGVGGNGEFLVVAVVVLFLLLLIVL